MRKERGFTLIELLVVIAILAVLFGVTALALNNIGTGSDEIQTAEKDVVQTAIDVCDAVNSCSPGTQLTEDYVGPATSGVGNYLRRTSKYCYTWGSDLIATEGSCP